MDPSYNNQVGGFGSGGISSGGGQVPQQPVMSPMSSAPISSGAGDVVLSSGKKSRKGLVIGLISVVLLVIGGLLAGMTLMRGSNSVSADAKTAFNRYANYLLYGRDSDAAIEGEYDEDENYEVYNLDDFTTEERKIFFEKVEKLLGDFESALGDDVNNNFEEAFLMYRSDLELTKMSYLVPINDSEFMEEYTKNDINSLKIWIDNEFSKYIGSKYENVRKYGEYKIKYYDLFAQYLDEAKNNGCLAVGGDSRIILCDGFADADIENQMSDIQFSLSILQSDAVNNVVNGCFVLPRIMDGETIKIEGGEE